jgi:hypothetical protein
MSPLRHDGEKVSYRPSGPSWIDEAIAEARSRGEFDDLPGTGQPLQLRENPLAGDWEMAFHVLENAGMAPPWMELSREIREGMRELSELRARAGRLAKHPADGDAMNIPPPPIPRPQPRFRWWPFRRTHDIVLVPEPSGPDLAALEAERQWLRRQYLEKAARVDEMIATYNAWLTDDLRQLRKPRLSPEKAAQEFDEVCPAIRCQPSS